MYRLKPTQAEFEMVDGPFAGRKFKQGESYKDIPPDYADRFESVPLDPGSKGGKK